MAKNLLDTTTTTFGALMGNGKRYKVPDFQRDYSWKEEHWEELWLDIKSLSRNTEIHYMGSIVLQNNGDKTFTIIDGQQRIATLTIIIIAAVKLFEELIEAGNESEKNEERKEIIIRRYLGDKDPTSLKYSSKLFLNENNDNFYQTNLLQLNLPLNKSRLNASDRLMLEAFEYFYNLMKESKSIFGNGERISEFIDKIIADKLFFIQIVVEDDLSAYTVFETLNARGLELTSTDLLKNYLFSLVKSKTDRQHMKVQWLDICKVVGIGEFPQFLRYYLNARQKLVRKERLFKEIRGQVKDSKNVFALLGDLGKAVTVYTALDEYEDDLWKQNQEAQKLIKELNLFQVSQYKPLLISAYFKLKQNEFNKLLRIVLSVTFRYTIIGSQNPNKLEDAYNRVAVKIFNGEVKNATGAMSDLKDVYPSDEEFKSNFSLKVFDTANSKARKITRYVLFSIENQLHNKNYPNETSEATIEHILPENLSDSWLNVFDREKHEEYVYRLGNLTLLEESLNSRDASNKSFLEKKVVYVKSQYNITKDLKKFEGWIENDIRSRQREMAKVATAIWRVDY